MKIDGFGYQKNKGMWAISLSVWGIGCRYIDLQIGHRVWHVRLVGKRWEREWENYR